MEVHRQQCQACGSRETRNIIVRAAGSPQVVLVRCAACAELVARYELASYYHHGRGFESWLRHLDVPTESALDLAETFESARADALEEYAAALEELKREDKES